jgi:CubicO group peptidase (beta-lactamase class C family)
MSKVVTAVAVLILVEEGRVRLTDPVSRFLPDFKDLKVAVPDPGPTPGAVLPKYTLVPAARAITVRDLLTHSSGLGSGPISQAEMAKEPQKPNEDLAAVVARMARAPLDFQPGTRFAYSGLAGFDTLGRIVEIASGMNLEKFLAERIYRPLGMTSTTFVPSASQRARLVTLYTRTGEGLVKAPNQDLLVDPVCFHGAGGLVGTAEDYYRFAQMLANEGELNGRRILSPRMVETLGSAQLVPGTVAGAGVGAGRALHHGRSRDGHAPLHGQLRLERRVGHPLLGRPGPEAGGHLHGQRDHRGRSRRGVGTRLRDGGDAVAYHAVRAASMMGRNGWE